MHKCGCITTHLYCCTFVCYFTSTLNLRLHNCDCRKNVQPTYPTVVSVFIRVWILYKGCQIRIEKEIRDGRAGYQDSKAQFVAEQDLNATLAAELETMNATHAKLEEKIELENATLNEIAEITNKCDETVLEMEKIVSPAVLEAEIAEIRDAENRLGINIAREQGRIETIVENAKAVREKIKGSVPASQGGDLDLVTREEKETQARIAEVNAEIAQLKEKLADENQNSQNFLNKRYVQPNSGCTFYTFCNSFRQSSVFELFAVISL